MEKPTQRYLTRLAVALVLYLVPLFVGMTLADMLGGPWRFITMIAVVPGVVLVAWAIWRYAADVDEMQSRKLVESLALAFAAGSVLTFTWGLFETVGAPPLGIIWAMPIHMVCWAISAVIVNRRY